MRLGHSAGSFTSSHGLAGRNRTQQPAPDTWWTLTCRYGSPCNGWTARTDLPIRMRTWHKHITIPAQRPTASVLAASTGKGVSGTERSAWQPCPASVNPGTSLFVR